MTVLTPDIPSHAELQAPLLLRSSKSLNWGDQLEVRTYREPDNIRNWVDPVVPEITLMFLTRGSMRISVPRSGRELTLRPGDLILKPAGLRGSEVDWFRLSAEPMDTLHLHVNTDLLARSIEPLSGRPASIALTPRSGIQDPLLVQIGHSLQREMETPSPVSRLYVESASGLIAAHLLRHYAAEPLLPAESDPRLTAQDFAHLRDYIHAHLSDDLSLEELAKQVGFSPFYFARLFRRSSGESVHQYVLRLRLDHARHLLGCTRLSISQVALNSGFAHQSHLTRAFRRRFGVTPASYRRATLS